MAIKKSSFIQPRTRYSIWAPVWWAFVTWWLNYVVSLLRPISLCRIRRVLTHPCWTPPVTSPLWWDPTPSASPSPSDRSCAAAWTRRRRGEMIGGCWPTNLTLTGGWGSDREGEAVRTKIWAFTCFQTGHRNKKHLPALHQRGCAASFIISRQWDRIRNKTVGDNDSVFIWFWLFWGNVTHFDKHLLNWD